MVKRKVTLRLGERDLAFFTDESEELVNRVFQYIQDHYISASKRYRASDQIEILAHILVNTVLEKVKLESELERLKEKYTYVEGEIDEE